MSVFRADGKVAVITGARRGIGFATARRLFLCGAKVALVDVEADGLNQAAAALESGEDQVVAVPADVTDRSKVDAAVELVVKKWGKIDILVNAAGIHEPVTIDALTTSQFEKTLRVNTIGVFHCTQAVLPAMIKQKGGSVVFIASLAGRRGHPTGAAHYAASKGAVISYMRSVAREVGGYGIRANCIAPGLIDTAMSKDYTADQMEAYVRQIPLGRIGQPEDVADAIAFLCLDASRFITGQTLNVCGGVLMQ